MTQASEKAMRIPILNREAAAFIKLRRQGYAISTLSKAFNRSCSVINHYLKRAILRGILSRQDLRKMPNQLRQRIKAAQWRTLMRLMPAWEKWILGEGDKPP